MSTPTKPGWVDVPGKGRRYWTGSEYRFYGPSDNAANRGQTAVSGDIAGMWNNFVGQFGRSTSDPKQVGSQSFTPQQVKDSKKGKPKNPAAPAKPAVKPSASLSIPPSAAQPGTGPKGNTVGSDADPETPGLQGPGAPKPSARVNANGLVSYGKDLSSLNQFTKAFTGGYEIADIKSAFQSNDLPTAYQNGSNKISTEETPYELPDGATPSNVGGKYSMGSGDISIENTGYKINSGSVPGTVGGNPADPQDGTSSKPDVADKIRQVRMARSEGSPRGFNGADFSGAEPDDSSLVSPMYANEKRNKIRSTFLDFEGSSVKAAAAANAVAGFGKDSNANPRFNYGGELVNAKAGMEYKAKNAAMMGQDPTQFLDIPATPETQPDTPAASELSPSFAKEAPGAQEFFKSAISKVKDKNK